MGLSSGKTKQTTNTTASRTTTPNVPGYIQSPVQSYYNNLSSLFSMPQSQSFGPSTNQQAAFNGAAGLTGNPNIGAANNATAGFLNYSAPQLLNMDLSGYTNPWQQNVIDAGLSDLERFRGMGINQGASDATRSGAFGGSRHGVADSLTNEAALRSAGDLVANLRSQGFLNAQNAAFQDIGNRMSGDQLRLGAAGQLLAGGQAADANARANIGTQADLGAQERAISQENDPTNARMMYLQNLFSLLGINPAALIGESSTGTENSTTIQKNTPSLIDSLGRLLEAGASAGIKFSDRRLKKDVEFHHADANGLNWYEFRYLWGDEKHLGVMADEAPPEAVSVHPSGYLMVDYAMLGG